MPRLILIYASMGRAPGRKFIRSWQQEPLAIGVLASLTPSDWEVLFYDDRMEEIDFQVEADLVGISIETYSARRGYQIAQGFRDRGVPVVFGGYHASLCPDEAGEHADAICIGEAEQVWREILADALRGSLKRRYQGDGSLPLGEIRVDRSLFTGRGYLPLSLIETGRGCPFNCNFCSIGAFYRSTYRRRPVDAIVRELGEIKGEWVFFVDDNFTGDLKSARELFAAVKPYRKKWMTQTSVTGLKDKKFVQEMAESGCMALLIGFESLNSANLNEMKKSVNRREEYAGILENLREAGIFVYGTFVFGYPHDTPELYRETVRFAIDAKMLIAAFNHLVPFPGTPLYAELESRGRMRYDRWWLSTEYCFGEVPYHPERVTAQDVELSCLAARREFYTIPSILRRAMDLKCNCSSPARLITYAQINRMLRNEVTEKRGMRLGFQEEG